MKLIRLFFAAIVMVSMVELYVLIVVGSLLGGLTTIALILLTAAIGSHLLRLQGLATWQKFQATLARQEVPAYEVLEGFLILLGGALLLTPGFITDAAGLACLMPSVRTRIMNYLLTHYFVHTENASPTQVLEGEFTQEK